jgi:hypothetical protein
VIVRVPAPSLFETVSAEIECMAPAHIIDVDEEIHIDLTVDPPTIDLTLDSEVDLPQKVSGRLMRLQPSPGSQVGYAVL